jgi:murein L,D-transpeptidase YcbB/YkuD
LVNYQAGFTLDTGAPILPNAAWNNGNGQKFKALNTLGDRTPEDDRMTLRSFSLIALVSTALCGASAGDGFAKGKDGWLTQQSFKRAQEQGFDAPDDGVGGFSPFYDFSDEPEGETFAPWQRRQRNYEFESQWGNAEPEVIAPRKRQADDYDEYFDPEPDASLSLGRPKSPDDGFENYQPTKLVALADPGLIAPLPVDPLARTLLQELRQPETAARVTERQRDAIITFYRLNSFRPLWVGQSSLNQKAEVALAVLAGAESEGLNVSDYAAPSLELTQTQNALQGNLASSARFDLGLTAMLLRYAEHIHSGRVFPNRMSGYYDLAPPALNLGKVLYDFSTQADLALYVASLAPPHPAYGAMKKALADLRAKVDLSGEEPIPAGERIKLGGKDARVPMIRARMIKLGFLSEEDSFAWMLGHPADEASDPGELELTLDKALSEAIKAFQQTNGLEKTGQVDKVTISALNEPSDQDNVQKLIWNMERMRWLPRDLGDRHIIVNQAAYELQIVQANTTAWRTKVIVGKPETQTNVFSDVMETVVLNPYWNVPKSILTHEMLPHLMEDPYYLDDKGYEVVNAQGEILSSGSVDWWSYGDQIPFDVRQPPGNGNALGNIKFLFPNKHNIYMHDTPHKKLFKEAVRAFSHGCVRVEDPRALAEHVLGWDRQKIDDLIASGGNQEIKLDNPVPVHLTYFTAWPDENGQIVYYSDVYKRDKRLEKALSTVTVALN